MYQQYYVYIMTNFKQTVLYVGVTNNIVRRAQEHKNGNNKGCFTYKYNCHTLVYYAIFSKIRDAIAEEKRLKAGNRQQKMNLINSMNPEWIDLAAGFYGFAVTEGVRKDCRISLRCIRSDKRRKRLPHFATLHSQ